MQHAPKLRPTLPSIQIHASRPAPLPVARDSGAPVFLPLSGQVGPLANEQHPAPARAQANEQYRDWPRMETSAGAAAGQAVAAGDLVTAGSPHDCDSRVADSLEQSVPHYKQQPLSHESLSRWYSIYILLQETTNELWYIFPFSK
ncbi:hypothetical protein TRIUR3_02255 [Triticum urartu]|uniref:Uncharacterized protein n=1 Tax=Triticum urartu TaxID=4572 RepID=M8A0A7_TRIUA|nr:hypothetical protein TRIUR3_02255 [Triticum urartu]